MEAIKKLVEVGKSHPHSLYAAYARSLQHKLTYLQRTTPGEAEWYQPIEEAVKTHLLPALTLWDEVSEDERAIFELPVKKGGLGILNPVKTAKGNFQVAKEATKHLAGAIKGDNRFKARDHYLCFTAATGSFKQNQRKEQKEAISRILESPDLPPLTKRAFERQSKYPTGQCFGRPLARQGLALTPYEFYDKLAVNFGKRPVLIPTKCVCAGSPDNTLVHTLTCGTGGNRIGRHNVVRDSLGGICEDCVGASSFYVSYEAWIVRQGEDGCRDGKRSDIRVRNLNEMDPTKETDVDIRIFCPDALSYQNKPVEALLKQHEKAKVDLYKASVEAKGRLFLPFVISTDGVIGEEGRKMMGWLGNRLAKKWGKDRSIVMSYIRARMSVAIVKSVSASIRGDRRPKNVARAGFEDGAALASVLS